MRHVFLSVRKGSDAGVLRRSGSNRIGLRAPLESAVKSGSRDGRAAQFFRSGLRRIHGNRESRCSPSCSVDLIPPYERGIGHYHWDRFFVNEESLAAFRSVFGNEREDYGKALERHYNSGAPAGWQENFISTYATAHPWEDWAETRVHYLHMADALETAASIGLYLKPQGENEPWLTLHDQQQGSFDTMVESWFSLTYLLNNLNRGLGLADRYPFILSDAVIQKLRFVHDSIGKGASSVAGQLGDC